MKKFLQYETFVIVGATMVLLTFLKLLEVIYISSDWFWFIAGIGLVIEGYLNLKKQKQFRSKYKVVSKAELEGLWGRLEKAEKKDN